MDGYDVTVRVEDFASSPIGELVPIVWTDSLTNDVRDHHAFVPSSLPDSVTLDPVTYVRMSEADRALGALDALVCQLPNPNLLVRPSLMFTA